MNALSQFVHYLVKVFDLPRRARSISDVRSYPQIPNTAIWLSLFFGAVLRVPSLLQLEAETRRRCWQRWIGYPHPISHDTFGTVPEAWLCEDSRGLIVHANKTLKTNKAFEANKIHGLMVVSLDANEQFHSRCRCCEKCLQRKVKVKNAEGEIQEVTEYYHRQVYLQMSGRHLNIILDIESQRPGEGETKAALRLLERVREKYGVRFFDVVTVDGLYVDGPWVWTVQQMGWAVVAVLKEERMDVWQESERLTQGQPPLQRFDEGGRQVQLWEVRHLPFSESHAGPVRVVRSHEEQTVVEEVGGRRQKRQQVQEWRWIATAELDGYGPEVIYKAGHTRWRIENNAFNELTQHWQLTHCSHHHPVAILVLLLIKVLAFNLFKAYALLHRKDWRVGKVTFQEMRLELYRAVEAEVTIFFFSG